MIDKIKKLFYSGEIWKMIKFGTVGASNTAVDFAVFFTLANFFGLGIYICQIAAYCIATLNSYILNRIWTFKSINVFGGYEALRFICVNLTSLITSLFLLWLFNGVMGLDKLTCKVLIAFFTVTINYLGNRLWVFKK